MDIKNLLYKEKFTIEGARKMLSQPQKNAKEVVKSEKSVVSNGLDKKTLVKIRSDLKSILDDLQN